MKLIKREKRKKEKWEENMDVNKNYNETIKNNRPEGTEQSHNNETKQNKTQNVKMF